MEMVALVLAGIFTVAVIQQQRQAMSRLQVDRDETSEARSTRRGR